MRRQLERRGRAWARRNRGLLWGAATAAALGGTAFAVARWAQAVERAHPPKGRFLAVDGVRLHYVERGPADAPALVLLHGNGATVEDWLTSGVVDRAATRYRVIAFDRPGFGHTERPRDTHWTAENQAALIARAIEILELDRPIVVGHSLGALVALALGINHPQSVEGLVLLSGYLVPTWRCSRRRRSPCWATSCVTRSRRSWPG